MADIRRVGHYELRNEIGRGGMATVFRAYDPRVKRDVAIKLLPREFTHDPTFRVRFEREAETIAALEHSAIVPVHDFGEEDGQAYLVMRYMTGGSLADRLSGGPLAIDAIVIIITRVGAALDSAHHQGVIHRDVKPGNILFDRHDDAYLSDFGIVRLSEGTSALSGSNIIGTPAYMAPEMAKKDGLTPLVDVYALGVTLYQMLSGRLPFEATTPTGMLMAHMNEPIPDIRVLRPDLAPDAQAVIEQALVKDPRRRYQSAGALAADCAALAGGTPLATSNRQVSLPAQTTRREGPMEAWTVGVETPPVQGRRSPQLRAMIAAGVGLVILVGAVLALLGGFISGRPQTPTQASAALAARDPRRLIFSINRESNWDIFAINADGSDLLRLTNNPAVDEQPAWSPDGTRIAFVSFRGAAAGIYVMNPDGSAQTLLARFQGAAHPAWSPDGKMIAFRSGSNDNPGLFVLNADGTGLTRLTDYYVNNETPAWSPDGSRIAFTSDHDSSFNVYVVSARGGSPANLTHDSFQNFWPVWAPDGRKIVYLSDHDDANIALCMSRCNWDLYVMNTDGSQQTRLTNTPGSEDAPEWAPDGRHIVYLSYGAAEPNCPLVDNCQDLWIMNADGSQQSVLANSEGAALSAISWSPDASQIAFGNYDRGTASFRVISASGGSPTILISLAESSFREDAPAWRP